MKVLLLIAPYNFCEIYPEYQAKKTSISKNKFGLIPGATNPLGLLYIAAVLKNEGHEVKVLDGVFYSNDEMKKNIKEFDPDVAGISVTAFAWERSKSLTSTIKKINSKIITVIGGQLPDAWQEKCLEEDKKLDVVSIGDGEFIMRDLCDAIENNKSKYEIEGIIWRNDKGEIVKNSPRPFIENLDDLPFPARELIDLKRYSPAIGHYKKLPNATIIGSRGCSGQCIFCHTKIFPGLGTRFRDPVKIVDEMQEVIKIYKVNDILFWDNNLTENKEWIKKLCREIIKRKLKIVWSGNTRADSIDDEIVTLMKQAGCWKLLLGVESGVQKNLDKLNKGEKLEQIENAVSLIKKYGISVFATFIFGLPEETYEEALQTIDFAIKLEPDVAKFFTLTCNPGSKLFSNFHEYGNLIPTSNAQSFHSAGFVPFTMKREQLQNLLSLANRKFYMRLSYIIRRALKIRSVEDIKQNFRGFMAFKNAK